MASKHTPGPWAVYRHDGSNRLDIMAADGDGEGGWIAHDISSPGTEREANARLIAAAPEMLEALREVTKQLAWYAGHKPELTERARALLARVDGGGNE